MNKYRQNDSKMNIVLDIETVVNPVTNDELQSYLADYKLPAALQKEYSQPKNIKDEAKLAAHYIDWQTARERDLREHKQRYDMDAVEAIQEDKKFTLAGKRMISCALGIACERSGMVLNIESWASDDLSVITQGVVTYLNEVPEYRLVGFNHVNFDLPELIKSFALTKTFPANKVGKWDVIDLSRTFAKTKLKDLAKCFGIETCGKDGKAVSGMYAEGQWDEIRKYNEDDVKITGEIFLSANRVVALY